MGEDQVEGAWANAPPDLVAKGDVDGVLAGCSACGGLKEAEDCLGVAKDVLGAHEATHRTAHRKDRSLSRDRCGRALGIRELLSRADGTEGNVVRHNHADGALDLIHRCPEECAVDRSRADGAMNDVVNLVALQAEDLREAATDLVQANHGAEGLLAVDLASHLRSRNHHGVKVVMAKLASRVPWDLGVVTKDGAVGVPLAHRRSVGQDGLLRRALDV
mmetsp:Transcript_46002/g.103425  ORF Transcript_46002/g.103425 Transcript_46002/m.103425 type:complete len:218 (-) Transcript_46002:403-1056(-)